MRDIEKALDKFISSGALATNQCPEYLRDAYFRAGYHSRDEELETTKRLLSEAVEILKEAKEGENIYIINGFLAKLSKEGER